MIHPRISATEWLALSMIAQSINETVRRPVLHRYLAEQLGIARPIMFVRDLIDGGLVDYVARVSLVTLTEYGACARRSSAPTILPWYLPVLDEAAPRITRPA